MKKGLRSLLQPRTLLGFAFFVLPWLWVVGTPTTHNFFVKQMTGSTRLPPMELWQGSFNYPYDGREWYPADLTGVPQSLAAQYPNDPLIQAKLAEQAAGGSAADYQTRQPRFAQMRAYRAVIARFPRERWLYSHYLRDTIISFQDGRLAGGFAGVLRPSSGNPPESTGKAPNFTPQQLAEAISIARQGQKVEPDNAFFGLYEGILLWKGHHDAEAWDALHRASLLPRFDEHNYEEAHAVSAVLGKWRGPLFWEEELTLSKILPYTHYSSLREMARQWSWAAWKLERDGHQQEAIAKRADVIRLFDKTMHGNNTLLLGMTSQAITQVMCTSYSQPGKSLSSFTNYVKAQGQPKLSLEMTRLGQNSSRFRGVVARSMKARDALPPNIAYKTRALWWLSCGLLLSLSLVLATWVFTSLLIVRAGGESATSRFVVATVLGCSLTTLLLYGKFNGATLETLFSPAGAPILNAPNLVLMAMQITAVFLPLLLPALLCSAPTWWHLMRQRRVARQTSDSRLLPRDMRPLIGSFVTGCAFLTVVGAWLTVAGLWIAPPSDVRLDILGLHLSSKGEMLPSQVTVFASVVSTLLLCGWLLKWRFFVAREERPIIHSALRRFRAVLGALLIVGSWGYALSLAVTIPIRGETDRLTDSTLRLGQIGGIEAQSPATSLNGL